jgi:hypothetical protein
MTAIYVVARWYGSDNGISMYGRPMAAFASEYEANEYVGASGLTIIELELQ